MACAIKKEAHIAKYGPTSLDPYIFSLHVLVERFCMALGEHQEPARIIVESRNPSLNAELRRAWEYVRWSGTRWIASRRVRERIAALEFRGKQENLAGLQIADQLVTPIRRHVEGRISDGDFRLDFNVIEPKFRIGKRGRYRGQYMGVGLKILPGDED